MKRRIIKNKELSLSAGYKYASFKDPHIDKDFSYIDLVNSKLTNSNFYNIWINYTVFENVTFINCKLENTLSSNTVFKNCDFFECIFSQVNLNNVTFENVRFVSADFRFCTLNGNFQDVSFSFDYDGIRRLVIIPDKFVNVTGLPDMVNSKPFIVHKKLYDRVDDSKYVVEYDIPQDLSNECSKAKVLKIYRLNTGEDTKTIKNKIRNETDYVVGETIYPDELDYNSLKIETLVYVSL